MRVVLHGKCHSRPTTAFGTIGEKKRKIKMIKSNTLFLECIEHQKIIVYPTVSDCPLALYDNSASIFLYLILTPVKLPAGNT